MAEIEHFLDPEGGKKHARFDEIQDVKVALLDRETQLAGNTTLTEKTVGTAVSEHTIDNETLGYFVARVQYFLLKIGVDRSKLRFRQHLANEMAHYASDCWDAELLTSYGWIECVGIADRSAYDLSVHGKRTGEPLVVKQLLPEPRKITEWQGILDKKKLGPKYRKDAKRVEDAVQALDQKTLEGLAPTLESKGAITVPVSGFSDGSTTTEIPSDLISIQQVTRVENVREYVPNVVEPSFGIGRILYSLLEQVYWHRKDDVARGVSHH